MKTKNEKTYKILLDLESKLSLDLRLVKLKNLDTLMLFNSEKFSKIIADKIVFVNGNNGRVDGKYNPHIATELMDSHCNNWRIDNLNSCIEKVFTYCVDKRTDYIVNFETGNVKRKLNRDERICRHCKAVVSKSEIVGAYCEKCLTCSDGIAYRFPYHGYRGKYEIRETKVNQSRTPLFGAEIERDYLPGWSANFDFDLKQASVESVKILYADQLKKGKLNRKSVFMRDGSLQEDGLEWITFPQTYKAYKKASKKIDSALEIMKKYNFGNSDRAGNHIHINRTFFGDVGNNNDESRFAGAKMALLLNEFWKEFIAIARRKDTSYTVKPSQNKNDKIFSLVAKTLNNELAHGVSVNLQHKDTIEIRIWGGIDSASDLLLFLDLTQALGIFAKKKSLEVCQKAKFIDILNYLTDKKEHLTEIQKRLNEKDIKKHDEDIENLIKEVA